jgi:NTP pyrophosphatase (non-canonical NTP hydrolase)
MTALVGELGEAANVLKKLSRVRDGIPGNKETSIELRQKLAEEIADTYIYMDLFCQAVGIDLEEAVESKFKATSLKIGYKE